MKVNDFEEDLARSHEAEDLPLWEETYRKAFPTMVAMINHREDGAHQRAGIDRSIILSNSKQILVDEKIRFKNKITGKVYNDIAIEIWSDTRRKTDGWGIKSLLCDYIAYAIAPLGVCYFMPVIQMQTALQKNKAFWWNTYQKIEAKNKSWTTTSLCVPANVVMAAISDCFVISFEKQLLELNK